MRQEPFDFLPEDPKINLYERNSSKSWSLSFGTRPLPNFIPRNTFFPSRLFCYWGKEKFCFFFFPGALNSERRERELWFLDVFLNVEPFPVFNTSVTILPFFKNTEPSLTGEHFLSHSQLLAQNQVFQTMCGDDAMSVCSKVGNLSSSLLLNRAGCYRFFISLFLRSSIIS